MECTSGRRPHRKSKRRRQCTDAHVLHEIYRKLYLKTLDAEEHQAGIEAVQSQNKLVNQQPQMPTTGTAAGSRFVVSSPIKNCL